MAEKDIILEEKTTEEKTTAETKEEIKEETPLEDVVLETEGGTKSLLGATSETGDIAATSLDTKTTPAGTDNLILFNQNTNVGYQIDYDNLADAILNKITSKTYANQVGGSSAATLLAQLSTLNSKTAKHYQGTLNNSRTFEKNGDKDYGVFFVMGLIGGYGAVCDLVPITAGNVGTVKNLISLGTQGSSVQSYSYSRDNGLTISSTSSAFCTFDIISF